MKAYHFTEMPYPFVPPEVEKDYGTSRIVIPIEYCDPQIAADLYNRYLDEYMYADDLGLDIMLNEHHQTMTCLDSRRAVSAPPSWPARRRRRKSRSSARRSFIATTRFAWPKR